MKMKTLGLITLLPLAATVSAFGNSITVIEDTATNLELDFFLEDLAVISGPDSVSYSTVAFPAIGDTFTFIFDDRLFFLGGNLETLELPNAMMREFNLEDGDLNFDGTYATGGYTVNYQVESTVTLGFFASDSWQGTLTATAVGNGVPGNGVPDRGTSAILLGLGLLGVAGSRFFVTKKN